MTSIQTESAHKGSTRSQWAQKWSQICAGTPRDRRNERRLLAWTAAWIGSWLAVDLALENEWLAPGMMATVVAISTLVLGLMTFRAFQRLLRETDELQRKINMDALALAMGVGTIGGMTYWLLERAGAVAEVDLLSVIVAMMVTYSLGVLIGLWRYS